MPILFADKRKDLLLQYIVRKGLEKKIIQNLLKVFDKLGSYREDILVAIGPSISKKNYLIDKGTMKEFLKYIDNKMIKNLAENSEYQFILDSNKNKKKHELIQLDLRKYAYVQLLNEKINNSNIDITSLCTYEEVNEFNSWRRNKTTLRQWSSIGP